MKKLLLTLLLFPMLAQASPYFRIIGPGNYHVYDGALFSTKDLARTQNTTVGALFTHSTNDGSILPQSWVDAGYAEAWIPLAFGGSFGGGRSTINLGPIFDFGPQLQHGLLGLLNWVAPNSLASFKTHLLPATPSSNFDITFSLGIMLNADAAVDGRFVKTFREAFQDPARYFVGPGLHFK